MLSCGTGVKIGVGVCEESQPKGQGYLFWRQLPGDEQVRVCDRDLFQTSSAVVVLFFRKLILSIEIRLGIVGTDLTGCESSFDNLSPIAMEMFRSELANGLQGRSQ